MSGCSTRWGQNVDDAPTVSGEGAAGVTVPYLDRMDLAYAAADLILCRSGAITVPRSPLSDCLRCSSRCRTETESRRSTHATWSPAARP